ncbi:AAA family ATPase [Loktanella sp. TSTF-M6]|uniref:AAA family ATPase n=1 Tax=Loktanella gaetbuli TaxID=2881335 RepID=A0ABS8BR63_9RHOB|nr:AAA family ATPase [Loktanella gaetbuli]MCB5198207.1 AAA family ATPase [Loktanella gaetbuli]
MDITDQVNLLADRIHALREGRDRILVAICGAPASGKSTLAKELARRLNLQKCPTLVVPMDGFHLDNAILDARDLRARKGAPETFDGDGFLHLIRRLGENIEVVAPMFDRTRDLSVAGAIAIPADCPVILVEGNYLMFDEAPWHNLADLWDLTVRVEVPMPQLRSRLIQRWLSLNYSRAAATRRAESNDIPNAQRVLDRAIPCEITLTPKGE